MATVTAFLKHNFISKAQQAEPFTAMAHARYIMRTEATSVVYSERMPRQYHAVQRFLEQHESGLRKNGRVLDKFIISIPHDVSEKDAVETLRRFGNVIGQNQTPFLFTLQGFDTRNHHAHFIHIDKSVEHGKRVFGTTERNSTHRLKLEWQRVANEAFLEMGYDVQVKVHEGYALEADNDNAQEEAQEAIDEASDVDDLPDMEDDAGGDEEAPFVTSDLVGVDPVGTIKFLHDQKVELEYLHRAQERLQDARERHEWLLQRRTEVSAEAGEFYQSSLPKLMNSQNAQERLSQHQRQDGQLKGRSLKVFGYTLFRTKERKVAEQVQVEAHNLKLEAEAVEYKRRSYDRQVDTLTQQAIKAEEAAYAHHAELLRLYGDESEVEMAEAAITNGIRIAAADVTLEQASEAYEAGLITVEEYRTFLLEAGYNEEVQLLDESLSEDGGASL